MEWMNLTDFYLIPKNYLGRFKGLNNKKEPENFEGSHKLCTYLIIQKDNANLSNYTQIVEVSNLLR